MIKSILLASTMVVAAPALAQTTTPTPPMTQTTPTTGANTPVVPQTATPTSKPATPASPATPAQPTDAQTTPGGINTGMTTQVDPQNGSATTTAQGDAATTSSQDDTGTAKPSGQTAQAAPANKADAVKGVVEQDWASYDANTDGKLDAAEFGKWMVALKTKADPSTKADDAATKSWVNGAFASADTDQSKSVSKAELTGFLSKG